MSDPRAVTEFRIAAADLRAGDVVNTSPASEDDWQEVLGVYKTAADTAGSPELTKLVDALHGNYVVVQLTDLLPVDSGVILDGDEPMIAGDDEEDDEPVEDVVSREVGLRTYLYTKYELVTVRG